MELDEPASQVAAATGSAQSVNGTECSPQVLTTESNNDKGQALTSSTLPPGATGKLKKLATLLEPEAQASYESRKVIGDDGSILWHSRIRFEENLFQGLLGTQPWNCATAFPSENQAQNDAASKALEDQELLDRILGGDDHVQPPQNAWHEVARAIRRNPHVTMVLKSRRIDEPVPVNELLTLNQNGEAQQYFVDSPKGTPKVSCIFGLRH